MSDGEPAATDPLVKALLRIERQKLDLLCDRLGVDRSLTEQSKYAEIGRKLAHQEPEFTGQRRGRPKKNQTSAQMLANVVDVFKSEWPYFKTDKSALEEAKQLVEDLPVKHPHRALFLATLPTLQKKLSEGRQQNRDELVELVELKKKFRNK